MALPHKTVSDPAATENFQVIGEYVIVGAGDPETRIAAPVGATFHRKDGGAGSALYVKESGGSGRTGWVAK